MELFFDTKNTRNLAKILYNIPSSTKSIFASVAYSTSSLLLDEVIKKKIELEWFGLFNSEEATTLELLEKAINNKQFVKFYPIRDNFHPKVIYFENYGIYIGSANMTEKAIYKNIEAGVFISNDEIISENYLIKIQSYFKELRSLSTPLTDDDLKNYQDFINNKKIIHSNITEIEKQLKKDFNDRFPHYITPKPGSENFKQGKNNKHEDKKKAFVQEWKSVQHELKIIMEKIEKEKLLPSWIPKTDAYGVITDQFLHSYYYSKVLEDSDDRKTIEVVEKQHTLNKLNKEKALEDALKWWIELPYAPSGEDKHINIWCPKNRMYLSKSKVNALSQDEVIDLLKHIHSARTHARQMKKSDLGLPSTPITEDECVDAYGKWLIRERSKNGNNILNNIYYLLYETIEPIEERLFKLLHDEQYNISHFGKSIMGEIIGWAMPEKYPIRNNRVNKALRALGYDVETI